MKKLLHFDMKKLILTLSCIAMAQLASAIDLTFWIGDKQITAGETVKFSDIVIDEYPEDEYKEVTMKPEISIMTSMYTKNVKVTATCTSGQDVRMCVNGSCRGGKSVTISGFTLNTNKKFDIGFDYVGELDLDEEIPTVVTTIEAEDTTDPSSHTSFVIEMGKDIAKITEVTESSSITPADGAIAYSAQQPTRLYIANVLGMNVFDGQVSGDGQVSLPGGLYIYRFGNASGKIYVK